MVRVFPLTGRWGRAAALAMAASVVLALSDARAGSRPGPHATVRLLDGGATGAGHRLAGIEIALDPGFITYWRSPGEAGMAPAFDFSGSLNVKEAKAAFPAPSLIDEDGVLAYGYAGDVIVPIDVTSQDVSAPVRLDVALDFAVCAKLCLPAKARLTSSLDGAAPGEAVLVREALAKVPQPALLGAPGPVRIDRVLRDRGNRLLVEAATPAGTGTLFVEAPDPWYFTASDSVAVPGGGGRLAFTLTGPEPAPPGPLPSEPMRLTLVTPSGSIEVPVRLDAVPAKP